MEIITTENIADQLERDILNSSKVVYLHTMELDARLDMKKIIAAAASASQKGVDVTIAFDYRANLLIRPRTIKFLERKLKKAGIKIARLGDKNNGTIVAGRSHGKGYVCDDVVYFAGGVNLTGRSFQNHDYMLRAKNQSLADTLLEVLADAGQPNPHPDHIINIDDSNQLLIDGGKKRHSLILDTAKFIARIADSAWYVSQLTPTKSLANEFLTDKVIYKFNRGRSSRSIKRKVVIPVSNLSSRVKNSYQGRKYIHCKFILAQSSSGELTALTGSHNFAIPGVMVGTKEIALKTTDQKICQQLLKYAEDL